MDTPAAQMGKCKAAAATATQTLATLQNLPTHAQCIQEGRLRKGRQAHLGTVHDGVTSVQLVSIVQLGKTLLCKFIPAVNDPPAQIYIRGLTRGLRVHASLALVKEQSRHTDRLE